MIVLFHRAYELCVVLLYLFDDVFFLSMSGHMLSQLLPFHCEEKTRNGKGKARR